MCQHPQGFGEMLGEHGKVLLLHYAWSPRMPRLSAREARGTPRLSPRRLGPSAISRGMEQPLGRHTAESRLGSSILIDTREPFGLSVPPGSLKFSHCQHGPGSMKISTKACTARPLGQGMKSSHGRSKSRGCQQTPRDAGTPLRELPVSRPHVSFNHYYWGPYDSHSPSPYRIFLTLLVAGPGNSSTPTRPKDPSSHPHSQGFPVQQMYKTALPGSALIAVSILAWFFPKGLRIGLLTILLQSLALSPNSKRHHTLFLTSQSRLRESCSLNWAPRPTDHSFLLLYLLHLVYKVLTCARRGLDSPCANLTTTPFILHAPFISEINHPSKLQRLLSSSSRYSPDLNRAASASNPPRSRWLSPPLREAIRMVTST